MPNTDSVTVSNTERNAVIYTKANRIAIHPADCVCDSCREAERKYRSDRSADLIAEAERESVADASPFRDAVGNVHHPCVYADCQFCKRDTIADAFYRGVIESVALLRANRVAGPYTITLADDFPGNIALAATISQRKRDAIADIIRDIFTANDADAKYVTERICDALSKPD